MCQNTIAILNIICLLLFNHLLKKKVLLRKFADDARIDRTLNNIYVSEKSVSCCAALGVHILSVWSLSVYQFQCRWFPQSPNLQEWHRFFISRCVTFPCMCVQTHCLNDPPSYCTTQLRATGSVLFIVPPSRASSANFTSSAVVLSSMWLIKILINKLRLGA